MPNILITIAARGGSKGVKQKNIRLLLNKPMIFYTIKQALDWGKGKHVVVSTDNEDIARVAKECGAQIPFMRPVELSTDSAGKVGVIKHTLIECEKKYNIIYDIVVDLDVTAPIRTVKDLDNCLKLFLETKPKTLVTAVHAHKNPYFNMLEINQEGNAELCKKLGGWAVRRQDAPEVYAMNTSIYFYDRNYLIENENPCPITDHTKMYIMEDISGVDIDREIDFKYIEFLVKEKVIQL